jgi:hypothetical protein
MDKLMSAAKQAVNGSLKVRKGENFLIVTDRQKMRIAEALAYWGRKRGAEVTTYLMTETLRPITGPTEIFRREGGREAVPRVYGRARWQGRPYLHDAGYNGQHDGEAREYRL